LLSSSSIEFFCVICGGSLTVAAEFAWRECACPKCGRTVPVPGILASDEAQWPTVLRPEILAVDLTFVCPGCDRGLVVDARAVGEPFTCPKCDASGQVPDWRRSAPSQEPATSILSPEEIDFLSGSSSEESADAGVAR
jgi:predicted RNA-binding Zn-ribbon protein involved in translation (DUF1610 family)